MPSGPTISRIPSFETLTLAASNRAFVITVIPRRVKLRSRAVLTSRSSSGTIWPKYSRSVTFVPRSWYIEANSHPTAPAPTITMSFGIVVERRTSSLVRIRSPSGVRPGSDFTREPVATMMSVAWRTRSPPWPGVPSSPGWVTRTLLGPSRRPRPATHTTLFLSTRVLSPVHIRFTTWSLRAAIWT